MRNSDCVHAFAATSDDLGLTRRGQMTGLFSAFVMVALAGEVRAARPMRRMPARDWIDRQAELARSLKAGQLRPVAWMDEVRRLAGEIDIAELMATVDASRVSPPSLPPTNDPRKRFVQFVDESGAPRKLGFGAALFDFSPTNVITPHGHRNMVSSHLVVGGRFRIRNFDRVRDVDEAGREAMVIRPTSDTIAGVGALSAMSSDRDNVHWFVPQGGTARTFDVVISGIDPEQPNYEITAIDPLGGRRLRDGAIVAPLMSFEASSAKYRSDV